MELVRSPKHWYDSRDNVADLVAWLLVAEPGVDVEYLLRKPWKYDGAYQQMRREEELERLADEAEALEEDAWRELERRAGL